MTEQFDDAYQELLSMLKEIETDTVSLNDLATKIATAKSLVQQCEEQLRKVENDVEEEQ
jgi:exodeoxyribonuclease VII small subunit